MWLVILLVAPVAIIVQAHYLSREVMRAVAELRPRARRAAAIIRRGYLALTYSVPALLVLYIIYFLIARPEAGGPPSHWIFEYVILLPFWVVTMITTQSVILIAPIHLLLALADRLRDPLELRWRRRFRWAVVTVTGFVAIYMPARIALESNELVVRHHRVAIDELPAELEGFTIGLVADPQADAFTDSEQIRAMVRAVNAHEPDLTLVAGDIISRDPAYIEPAAAALGELEAPLGVFSAIGDHDNFAYRDRGRSLAELTDALARHGIALDNNRVRRFGELAVVIATHNYINRITGDQARELLARAGDAEVVVVLVHQANGPILPAAREAGADLVLAGHTHGGQVRLWWYGLDVVAARIESPYVTGHYRGGALGKLQVIVSSGLGTSVMPFRYRAPATAEIIELVRR